MSGLYVIAYIHGFSIQPPLPNAAGFYLLLSGGNYAASQPIGRCIRCKSGVSLQSQLHLYTPSQRQSGKPGCFCLHRFEVIVLTVCPLNGNCIYNHRTDTSVDCCGRSACAYPGLQKQQLARGIAELLAIIHRNPAQEEKLQRYRRYFRELHCRGGDP